MLDTDYKLKYLKYKNKYNILKNNSYKYFVFNTDYLNEAVNSYKKETNNEVNKKTLFKNLDEFNSVQRKIFKDIQTKSREEAIQGFKKEKNLNNFQANSLHYVYNYLVDNFDKINSKYLIKQIGKDDNITLPDNKDDWKCDTELRLFLTFLTGANGGLVIVSPIFGITNGVIQILCKNYIYAGLSIVNGILGAIPAPITQLTSIPLLIYDTVQWWKEDSKRKDSEFQKRLNSQLAIVENKTEEAVDRGIDKVSNKIDEKIETAPLVIK